MIEKVTKSAEAMATGRTFTRQEFMRWLAQQSLVAAGAVSGLILAQSSAKADGINPWGTC